jgi:hypothetical protein
MMMVPRKLLMVGLRGTGKSTFLATLWHTVEGSSDKTISLFAPRLQPDREYLNALRTKWLSFQQVGRTSVRAAPQHIRLTLEQRTRGDSLVLEVPDMSGESFRLQWVNRKCKADYVERVAAIDGLLLFVHPLISNPGHRIPHSTTAASPAASRPKPPIDDEVEWDPEGAPTQVQLVDILQILLALRAPRRPLPLSIIVSAWDEVPKGMTPDDWLAAKLPLVDQFVRARRDAFAHHVFGLSAQGGDLSRDLDRLQRVVNPIERVALVSDDEQSNDVSKTISWMMDDWHNE